MILGHIEQTRRGLKGKGNKVERLITNIMTKLERGDKPCDKTICYKIVGR